MDLKLIPSIFITLFVVVDPLGIIPIFTSYLSEFKAPEQKKIIFRSISVAAITSLLFIFFGNLLLNFLGVTSGAFLIAGGILLFFISIDLLFARPSRTKTPDLNSITADGSDISVFPIAIPLLCGPGNIAALLMFSSQFDGDYISLIIISLISAFVFLLSMIVMFLSVRIDKILGKTGISVLQRIMGLLLSAMAVQFILNGLKQAGII